MPQRCECDGCCPLIDVGRLAYWAFLTVDGHGRSARWFMSQHSPKARGPPRKSREESGWRGRGLVTQPFNLLVFYIISYLDENKIVTQQTSRVKYFHFALENGSKEALFSPTRCQQSAMRSLNWTLSPYSIFICLHKTIWVDTEYELIELHEITSESRWIVSTHYRRVMMYHKIINV